MPALFTLELPTFDSRTGVSYAWWMCMICIDFDRRVLKLDEARRALGEMRGSLSAEHVREVEKKLDDAARQASASSTKP